LGVFTWAPFIFLKAMGEEPMFLAFLSFHLFGVIGGAHLRSIVRKELGLIPNKKNYLTMVDHLMILRCGVIIRSDESSALPSQ
jgi:hypothetical protein